MSVLQNGKVLAFNSGDIETINKLDADLISTQNSINQLVLLKSINSAASAANTTPTEMMASGIETAQIAMTYLEAPLEVLKYYDIVPYATDPLHEEKIADILGIMGEMNSPAVIDAYIDKEAIGSPVTAAMILSAATKYEVDVRLMMALMEQDSRFGTAGLAIRTLNPGNVGNDDDGNTRTYSTWDEGVEAVAKWLSNHRIVPEVAPVAEPVAPVVPVAVPVVEIPAPKSPIVPEAIAPVASTTPLINTNNDQSATTTPSTSSNSTASTTAPVIVNQPSSTASSTEAVVPPVDTATTTPSFIPTTSVDSTTPQTASTTQDILPSTEAPAITEPTVVPPAETQTTDTPAPETTATSTQARVIKIKRNRV